jgi:hypothetical protein
MIKENKDGSADCNIRFDKEGLEVLIQWGFVALLTKAIDEYKVRPDDGGEVVIKRAKKSQVKKESK